MKKILLAVMAVMVIGLTSCGNKTQQGEAIDSVALVDSLADEAIQETISALSSNIEAGDASKLQETLEAVKAQVVALVKENPELAKACVTKLQQYLKENGEKVKAVVGDNAAAQTAIDALTSIDAQDGLAGLIGELANEAAEAKEDAEQKAADAAAGVQDAANVKVEEVKEAVKQKAEESKETARQKANEAIDNAAQNAKKSLGL